LFRSTKPKVTNFRAEYAKHADFCDALRNDTEPLYRLAFLLTANHKESEQCFVSTVEQAFDEQTVFKEWARSWIKRRLIQTALEIVSPASSRASQKRDFWGAGQHDTKRECEIDAVTKLDPFERFVFVMSILERYSNWDCALLLGCSMNTVTHARMTALRRLPSLAHYVRDAMVLPMPRLRITDVSIYRQIQ
jgi:DNA-directed RNA polymerase specialized sigma24 family protein